MKKRFKTSSRNDRLLQERNHDTYKSKRKLSGPTACPECGAVFHAGRWSWAAKPAGAHESLCPACRRVRDRYPAGYVTLAGKFTLDHHKEVLGLAHNVEAREKAEHPLKRIMDVQKQDEEVLITTTDMHLARSIGDALKHAYEGELAYQYTKEQNILRVSWRR
jgi:NMD protein affecting ribosome stability and mRNA decay